MKAPLLIILLLLMSTSLAAAQRIFVPDSVCTDFGAWAYHAAQSRDKGVKYKVIAEAIETYEETTRLTTGERLAVDMMKTALPSIYGAPQLTPKMIKVIMIQSCFDARKSAAKK